jgi:hypothetical protein
MLGFFLFMFDKLYQKKSNTRVPNFNDTKQNKFHSYLRLFYTKNVYQNNLAFTTNPIFVTIKSVRGMFAILVCRKVILEFRIWYKV